MKFQVKDKVKIIRGEYSGKIGYVTHIINEHYYHIDEHLKVPFTGSFMDGYGKYYGHLLKDDLELISSSESIKKKITIMNKLTSKIKRLFSPDLQTQYKAGLIDNCGDLTDKGQTELREIQRDKFSVELTAAAQNIIDEEKEDK